MWIFQIIHFIVRYQYTTSVNITTKLYIAVANTSFPQSSLFFCWETNILSLATGASGCPYVLFCLNNQSVSVGSHHSFKGSQSRWERQSGGLQLTHRRPSWRQRRATDRGALRALPASPHSTVKTHALDQGLMKLMIFAVSSKTFLRENPIFTYLFTYFHCERTARTQ